MKNKPTVDQQKAIAAKATEVESTLNQWMKECGLFSPGDRLEVVIRLERDKPVSVLTEDVKKGRGSRFVIESKELSEAEWSKITELFARSDQRTFVEMMRKTGNKPLDGEEFRRARIGLERIQLEFDYEDINNLLYRADSDIRIRNVGRNAQGNNNLWQMCKVRRVPR